MCVRMFIVVSDYMCMSICICTVFLKKVRVTKIFSASQLMTVLRFQAYVVLSRIYSFRVCYLAFLIPFLLNVRHNLPLPLKSLLQDLQKSM
jgi:hypothetical protein